ncbi:MAG TPA: DUF58 domain-containing protein [Gemmatimonadaceae bacterium]|nr:DUF58 domain-containing protein [Gemmatimonadaceae bacterium]
MPVGPYGALLDAVRGVRWPARRPVPGGAPGAHQARSRGIAPEFAEYRPYRQGDDTRRIDWKLLARSDRAFIRLAPDQAILGTTFIVDASASMDFPGGSADAGKWLLAKRLVIALAAAAHGGADPVGLIVASGAGVQRLAPRTRRGVIAEMARTLDDTRPVGSAPLAPLVPASRSRCVVVTDCLGDLDALRAALARHRARGGEAHVLHVVARAELEPAATAVMATDPEDPACQRPLLATTRAAYRDGFDAFRAETARAMLIDGVHYHEVVDDDAPEIVVRRIVMPVMAR